MICLSYVFQSLFSNLDGQSIVIIKVSSINFCIRICENLLMDLGSSKIFYTKNILSNNLSAYFALKTHAGFSKFFLFVQKNLGVLYCLCRIKTKNLSHCLVTSALNIDGNSWSTFNNC